MSERRWFRPAWLEIDLGAVESNAATLAEVVAPAGLCAVVKADAYGHGAAAVARASLAGGASLIAVALVEEGIALREAGLTGPVLVLAEPCADAMAEAVAHRLTLTLYTAGGVAALERAVAAASVGRVPVHVKVDTGMHRVGADPGEVGAIVGKVVRSDALGFDGFWTHLAVADDPADDFTAEQLARFEKARRSLTGAGLPAPRVLHAANSAGALAHPSSRYDFVRCGIALYGYPPSAAVAAPPGLRRVLSWKARVAMVRDLEAGERTSYGRSYQLARPGRVAVVPVGYRDGVPRRLFDAGGEVLIGGRRCPLAGSVTMDQLVVDCGPGPGEPASAGSAVAPGDEVVLIGEQRGEEITAEDWAARLGTISYEVLCGIGPRVPRRNLASPAGGNGQARSAVPAGRAGE